MGSYIRGRIAGDQKVADRWAKYASYNSPSKQPPNGHSNDSGSTYQSARGSNDYSCGKVSPRFQNNGAEIEPHGHGETTRRNGQGEDYLRPAQRRALESRARFAKGGP